MLTKLSAILDVAPKMGSKTLAEMMGVILAGVRSSVFLATAKVSILFDKRDIIHLRLKDK